MKQQHYINKKVLKIKQKQIYPLGKQDQEDIFLSKIKQNTPTSIGGEMNLQLEIMKKLRLLMLLIGYQKNNNMTFVNFFRYKYDKMRSQGGFVWKKN